MYRPDLKEYEKDFCIYAQERTGKSGMRFFRRGFPFSQGVLQDENDFYLKGENGEVPTLQTKIIEKHEDGSIKWLSVAFSTKLDAYCKLRFDGAFKKRADKSEPIASETKDVIELKNKYIAVKINKKGYIESILPGKKEVLGENGVRISIADQEKKVYFSGESAEIYVQGSVYAVVRIKGAFAGTGVSADWFITLTAEESRLTQRVKFNTKGDSVLLSEAIEIDYADDMRDFTYSDRCPKKENLVFTDSLTVSDKAVMTSKDVTRFRQAVAPRGVHNGYAIEGGTVIFSPIQYGTAFLWPDGVSRTIHLDTVFEKVTDDVIEREVKWDYEPPIITIPSKWFVAIGITDDDSQSEAIWRIAKALESLYGFYWGNFEAGLLPNSLKVNSVTEVFTCPDKTNRSNGEIPYNLLRTYMNFGFPVMYDMMMEYVEFWTDVIQYRGMHEALRGANRYHSGDYFNDHENFCTSMPYYGDLSGLYIAYCMTGEPYYEEAFREGIDFFLEDIDKNGVPILSYWTSTMFGVHKSPEFQTRCSIITRTLNFAARLYGDNRYLEAAKSIMRWMAKAQNENGSFYEDYYYDTFEPWLFKLANGEWQPLEKQYIMTFGARGYSEYCRETKDETGIKVLERLCDYFVASMDELGFMWYPNNDDEKANDGGGVFHTRGSCSITTAGAMYTIAVAYSVLPKPEYLLAVLKMARYCIALWGSDGCAGQLQGSQTAFLQGIQSVSRLIKENMDFVLANGFIDVVALLDTNTREAFGKYPCFDNRYRRFGINTFDTKWGEMILLLHRKTANHSYNTHLNKAFDFEMELARDRKLWYGGKNVVNMGSDVVSLREEIRVVELISLLKTDITISDLTGETIAEVVKYTEDEVTLRLSGSGFDVTVEDGFFRVIDGEKYSVVQRGRSRVVTAKDRKITFNMRPSIEPMELYLKRIK